MGPPKSPVGRQRDKVHSSLSCSEEKTRRARLVNPVMTYGVRGRAETEGESAQKGQQKKRLQGENSPMGLGVILRAICHCVCVCVCVCATTWTIAGQAPLSLGFSRQAC